MYTFLTSNWSDLVLAAIFPLLLLSLWKGSNRYGDSKIKQYYDAQKYLQVTSDIFIVMLSLSSIAKLGFYFGYLPTNAKASTMMILGAIVGILAFASISMHIAAIIKVWRAKRTSRQAQI